MSIPSVKLTPPIPELAKIPLMRYTARTVQPDSVPPSRLPTVEGPLRQLTEILTTSSRSARLVGVPHPTAEAFAFAKLFPLLPTAWQIVYLIGSEKEQQVAEVGLAAWQPSSHQRPIVPVPPITAHLLDRLQRHEPVVLIAQQSAFAESLPHPNELKDQFLSLHVGDRWSPVRLSGRLAGLGYEVVKRVSQPGQWAKRGDVIDVWPLESEPAFRLAIDQGAINSITTLSEQPPTAVNTVRCSPMAMDKLDPRISLLAYLQPMRTLIVVPRQSLLDSLPRGKDAVKHYKQLLLEPFGSEGSVKLDWRAAASYHGQWPLVSKDWRKLLKEKYRLVVHTRRREELLGQLQRQDFPLSTVTWLATDGLQQGFIAPTERFAYFTDAELFGRNLRARSNRRRVEDVFLGDLTAGDFVVHLDHGIGKFMGMRLHHVDEHTKEYFVIEYAEGDKLYVPVETADKITRYIGSPHPKLHKLSGSSWLAVTKKIRADASQAARELLDLYAQRELAKAPTLLPAPAEEEGLAARFPYELTSDQERTLQETLADLERDVPMDRLVCGDVGFGKTEVAIRAAFRAVMNHKQVALLSPTTILTQQHLDTFKNRLKDFPVRVAALSRFESKEEQRASLDALRTGQIDIVIGTHRLLSQDVKFKALGLIIIDEEQRFGVKHKEKLKAMRTEAHVLTLTATPIPRTLNFALSGLRDISVIETPPEGRRPIETNIMPHHDETVVDAIERELNRRGQVYYVHNDVATMNQVQQVLRKLVPRASIGLAHGQMDEQELSGVMAKFDNQQLDILLASTIIENGLDLPNVNTLIVDHATQFGLAQLYQLRGRIGRGDRQAYAYFLYRSEKIAGKPSKRLQALMEAKELGSGFRLAMRDLEIRGTGNILGKKQHGHVTAIGLNLYARLLAQAVEELRTGKPARASHDILLDLPMEIAIPKDFVASEPKRLRLYQRLAGIETVADLHGFRTTEFRGLTLPEPLINLLEALELKILAQRTPITAVQESKYTVDGINKQKIIIKFSRMITPEQIGRLLERNQAWDFTTEFIKIDRKALGKRWLHELKEVVKIFEEPEVAAYSHPSAVPATGAALDKPTSTS